MHKKLDLACIRLCTFVLLLVPVCSAQTNPNATPMAQHGALLQERDYRVLRVASNNLTKEELTELRAKGAAGDLHAQLLLGMAYQQGCPEAKHDSDEALHWYHLAADQGSSIAAGQIAVYYDPAEKFSGDRGHDADQALIWYRKAAERGDDTVAQGNMAAMLLQMGRHAEALEWYRKATENGSPTAAVGLVELYDQGKVLPDKSKSENWKEGAEYFQKLADQGNLGAEYVMATGYREGWLGLPKDPVRAFDLFRKAAAQNWTRAILQVGDCYFKGSGVAKDRTEALKWLKQAADEGDPIGASYMVWFYEHGEGVARDLVEAYAWNVVASQYGKGIRFEHRLKPEEMSRAEKRAADIGAQWGIRFY